MLLLKQIDFYYFYIFIKNITEEDINKEESECECGSGKKASDCCQQKDKPCSCGSGKKASDCYEQD